MRNVLNNTRNILKSCREKSMRLVRMAERRGLWALFVYALLGSMFLPIPIDSVLSGLVAASPKRWLRTTLAFAVASVMGGIVTYSIGYGLIDFVGVPLIRFMGGEETWQSLVDVFHSGKGTAYLATVSFLVGPYKLSMLAAGATGMKISIIALILLITRTARFFIIGFVTRFLSHWYYRIKSNHRDTKATETVN